TATGQFLYNFLAFDASFMGGVRVAVADVFGNGSLSIIAAAGPGGLPLVSVFSAADGSLQAAFLAFDAQFNGGVFVAAGDLNGDGLAEIVTGAGTGGMPLVNVRSGGTLADVETFVAYDPGFQGGVRVAVGDVLGIGRNQIVTAAGPGGLPLVLV